MKRVLLATTISLFAAVLGAAETSEVTFVDHDAVAKGGSLVSQQNLSILMAHRTGPGMVEVHDTETDTIYVVDGSATIVTGGTMIGGSVTAPGQHRGADITGGQTRQLVKGDVMVIPAGIPHWFKDVPSAIDYYVVKVIAE
jgi:mannose-6-phosphate isomerase-like protein (cupin superfamily)